MRPYNRELALASGVGLKCQRIFHPSEELVNTKLQFLQVVQTYESICKLMLVEIARMSPLETKHGRPRLLNNVAFERIKRDIVRCVLEPGREVTEAQLAARYTLGKAPVRAALFRLRQAGFLRAIPRKGYVIAPITVRDVQEIFQLRLLLEPTAARLAAGRLSQEQLGRLDDLCRVTCTPGEESSESAVQAHWEVHSTIARASGNQRLADVLAKLYDEVERLIHLGLSRIDPQEMYGYKPLVEALAAGDGEEAARLMVEQIELGRKRIMEALLSGAGTARIDAAEAIGKKYLALSEFTEKVSAIIANSSEAEAPLRVAETLPGLLRNPSLLSAEQRASSPHSYRKHVLYVDPGGRFSVLALVWEGGQATPVHDHICWCVAGVYEGEQCETCYRHVNGADGSSRLLPIGVTHHRRGDVTYVDLIGPNVHRVDNPASEVAISVHVYGMDIRKAGSAIGTCYLPEDITDRSAPS